MRQRDNRSQEHYRAKGLDPRRLTRRTFIGRSGGVVLAIGGIGGFASAARAGVASSQRESGEVVVLTWGDPNAARLRAEAFKEETGIALKMVPGTGDADFFNKIRAGGLGTYDVVISNVGFVPLYAKAGLIESLDLRQFPAAKELYPQFRTDLRFPNLKAPNVAWAFPRQWGAYSMTYSLIDKYRPTTRPISWQELWKAPQGKVMLDGFYVTNLALAGRMLGIPWKDVFSIRGATLERAVDRLRELKPFLEATAQQSAIDAFRTKRTDVGMIFGLGFASTVNRKVGKTIARSVIPKEGVLGALDGIMLLKRAPNRRNALKFINFEGGKRVQLLMWDLYRGPTANRAATEAIIGRGGLQRKLLLAQQGDQPDIAAAMIQLRNPDYPDAWNRAWDHVLAR